MGVCVHLDIAQSVTSAEWKKVYDETLKLVKAFPLAEYRQVVVRGIERWCLVRTQEREERRGWFKEETTRCWHACGDMKSLATGEDYSLRRDYFNDIEYIPNATDPILYIAREYLPDVSKYSSFDNPYNLWDNKTQGHPYHLYLLAIACLVESRLGNRAYVRGDITKGQCERAVRMANKHLNVPIQVPDRCNLDRLLARVSNLPLTEADKIHVFAFAYIGRKDACFGVYLREHFSKEALDQYWKDSFAKYKVNAYGFGGELKHYLAWGFGLESLCSYVRFVGGYGTDYHKTFVNTLMATELYLPSKDTTDALEIDPDQEQPYGIETVMAQFAFMWDRNRRVNRYIPLDRVRSILSEAIGDVCPTGQLIDEYLEREGIEVEPDQQGEASEGRPQQDGEEGSPIAPNDALNHLVATKRKEMGKYAITSVDELLSFAKGDTMAPSIRKTVAKSFVAYRSCLDDFLYQELMGSDPDIRCRWLQSVNKYVELRDTDWERICDEIMEKPDAFGRYYPMVRVNANYRGPREIVKAFVLNDDLYAYAAELADALEEE